MSPKDVVDRILEQWARERPDLDHSPIGVIGRLSRITRDIEQELEPAYQLHGLNGSWYDVLATLRRAGAPFRLRPSELAYWLMLTSSGTTKRLDRLEQAWLIERLPDPKDRRGVLIALTDQGRKRVDDAIGDHLANEHALLSALTPAEQQQLADLLRKLGRDLRGRTRP
jgi:DNA-binding MarR family transcriptional regulator